MASYIHFTMGYVENCRSSLPKSSSHVFPYMGKQQMEIFASFVIPPLLLAVRNRYTS
ncbi:Predicted protein [Komagataella phaffii CBS 7435]|nr:Predicted protein [Komagataella phaffii CBS 7435]